MVPFTSKLGVPVATLRRCSALCNVRERAINLKSGPATQLLLVRSTQWITLKFTRNAFDRLLIAVPQVIWLYAFVPSLMPLPERNNHHSICWPRNASLLPRLCQYCLSGHAIAFQVAQFANAERIAAAKARNTPLLRPMDSSAGGSAAARRGLKMSECVTPNQLAATSSMYNFVERVQSADLTAPQPTFEGIASKATSAHVSATNTRLAALLSSSKIGPGLFRS